MYKKILNKEFNVSNGKIILTEDSENFEKFLILGKKQMNLLLEDITEVNGTLNLIGQDGINAPKLKKINGNLFLDGAKNIHLDKLEEVNGIADITNPEGYIYLKNLRLTDKLQVAVNCLIPNFVFISNDLRKLHQEAYKDAQKTPSERIMEEEIELKKEETRRKQKHPIGKIIDKLGDKIIDKTLDVFFKR